MSNSTGVNDSIVNQLLSKIDGVDSLNNILVIGMTNRKDMIDDAVLRPGRLEVHSSRRSTNKRARSDEEIVSLDRSTLRSGFRTSRVGCRSSRSRPPPCESTTVSRRTPKRACPSSPRAPRTSPARRLKACAKQRRRTRCAAASTPGATTPE